MCGVVLTRGHASETFYGLILIGALTVSLAARVLDRAAGALLLLAALPWVLSQLILRSSLEEATAAWAAIAADQRLEAVRVAVTHELELRLRCAWLSGAMLAGVSVLLGNRARAQTQGRGGVAALLGLLAAFPALLLGWAEVVVRGKEYSEPFLLIAAFTGCLVHARACATVSAARVEAGATRLCWLSGLSAVLAFCSALSAMEAETTLRLLSRPMMFSAAAAQLDQSQVLAIIGWSVAGLPLLVLGAATGLRGVMLPKDMLVSALLLGGGVALTVADAQVGAPQAARAAQAIAPPWRPQAHFVPLVLEGGQASKKEPGAHGPALASVGGSTRATTRFIDARTPPEELAELVRELESDGVRELSLGGIERGAEGPAVIEHLQRQHPILALNSPALASWTITLPTHGPVEGYAWEGRVGEAAPARLRPNPIAEGATRDPHEVVLYLEPEATLQSYVRAAEILGGLGFRVAPSFERRAPPLEERHGPAALGFTLEPVGEADVHELATEADQADDVGEDYDDPASEGVADRAGDDPRSEATGVEERGDGAQ